jgi:hypothetical protein
MKYISSRESSDWLRLRGIIESPYSVKPSKIPYKQYRVPKTSSSIELLLKRLLDSKAALLIFTDWVFPHPDNLQFYKPHQVAFIRVMENIASQNPDFSKGLAFFYEPTEHAGLVSDIKASLELYWSVYFYPETASATLYFWEGELIDVWSASKSILKEIGRLLS